MYRFNLLKSPTSQTESDHQDFLKYTIMLAKQGHPYIHSTTVLCDSLVPRLHPQTRQNQVSVGMRLGNLTHAW